MIGKNHNNYAIKHILQEFFASLVTQTTITKKNEQGNAFDIW